MKLKIGNVTLENNLVLAPMAGVTDLPFRLLCKEQGAGLICTEMVSAKAIFYKNKNTECLMQIDERERPRRTAAACGDRAGANYSSCADSCRRTDGKS